ncbi:hypothetical protein Tco_0633838 [Tanacetum coccineum]
MLAPGNYIQWKSIIKIYIDTKPNHELIHFCLKNPPYQYKFLTTYANATPVTPSNEGTSQQQPRGEVMETFTTVPEDIHKWITAEAEAVQIILMGIDNDIYSIVDACPNAIEISQAATRNKGKAIANSPLPTYDLEPKVIADDDESSKEMEIDKLIALILMSFKKIYKPTNNNLITSSNTRNKNVDNTPRSIRGIGYGRQIGQYDNQKAVNVAEAKENVGTWARDLAYHKERMLMCKQEEAGIQLSAEQVDWRDDIDDEPEDQELEARYLYMAKKASTPFLWTIPSWTMSISLTEVEMKCFTSRRFTRREKDMLYVKKNKADLPGKVTSKVGIEERDIESKEPPLQINAKRIEELSYLSNKLNKNVEAKASVLVK